MNRVIKKGKFDAGHRLVHHRFKCANIHGHEYHYELHYQFEEVDPIGFKIDFSEIKRIVCAWIDHEWDHALIVNPKDEILIDAARALKSRFYPLHLVDSNGFCNPTAELIAKELFYVAETLMEGADLKLSRVRLQETVSCIVECEGLTAAERSRFRESVEWNQSLTQFRKSLDRLEYDSRKT